MKDIKFYIKEALKINSKSKVVKTDNKIDSSKPGSVERACLVFKVMEKKYGDRFDEMYINNENNICMYPDTKFHNTTFFIIDLNLKEGFSFKYHISYIGKPKNIETRENFNDLLKELDKFIKGVGF